MKDFSFWVILSNLLLATRWTILLSLVAFVCGGIVGLALLFARRRRSRGWNGSRAATSSSSRARRC